MDIDGDALVLMQVVMGCYFSDGGLFGLFHLQKMEFEIE